MRQAEYSRFNKRARHAIGAAFAATLVAGLLAGANAPLQAQGKLTPAQRQSMTQCLIGCNKGDASCQNDCAGKNASPAYVSTSGVCVRACADALVLPGGRGQAQAGDLQICLQACD